MGFFSRPRLSETPRLPETLVIAGRTVQLVANRRARSQAIRLRVNPVAGAVEISLPPRGGLPQALRLLETHQDWLATRIKAFPAPRPLLPGACLPFDGRDICIDWHAGHPRAPVLDGDRLQLGGPVSLVPGRVLRWLKAAALADMTSATHDIAAMVGRPVAQVRIGDPRARWGSCAGSGGPDARIAYSWRLILAPSHVRRNVVAHEVAHLVHADHGPGFHALLARLDPHAGETRRWLARHGPALHWVGREA
ncbi:SprT family zinc-dependent metalloprotease [Sandarakinorhabdus sp.]|uniref:M48 family metallopeptidase n=1 Tax=Sandarakinorhabdus sp. TaxID=1916663 RepID=UPI00286DBEE8|nr:SprT family zinc-dependent metalloprotease [Sandarakinorhabdus sp.]